MARKGFSSALPRTCVVCGAGFTARPSEIKRGAKFCSKKCQHVGFSESNNPRWSGGRHISSKGYQTINVPGRGKVLEHRYIMEQHLGRPLLHTEEVHHKDENKLNNDLSNLEILTRSQHDEKKRKYVWTKNYPCCVECGTDQVRHGGFGLCRRCYLPKYNCQRGKTKLKLS